MEEKKIEKFSFNMERNKKVRKQEQKKEKRIIMNLKWKSRTKNLDKFHSQVCINRTFNFIYELCD